jgi:MoxR-like ATPase
MAAKERIKTLLDQLNTGIYEKEEVMALALLSSVAGESIFLLGPPGVAKSLIARRLKYAYKDAKVFEYLMSRFSTPDEIFGPVSISELKNNKYIRIIDGYLPAADVVFLDEIWKASPSIQNTLLTILNEKKFRNGKTENEIKNETEVPIERDAPIKALISASNELPAKDQGLEALWDRFLVRLVVEGIEDIEKFNEMVAMPSTLFDEKIDGNITDNEYKEWSKKIDEIVIHEDVFDVIKDIRKKIGEHNIHDDNKEKTENQINVSDRRWRKIVRLMRTSAFLNDRLEVDLMDCFLIKHCIWNEKWQIQTVSGFVNETIQKHGPNFDTDFQTERDQFEKLKTEIEDKTGEITEIRPAIMRDPKGNEYYYFYVDDDDNKYNYHNIFYIKKSEMDEKEKDHRFSNPVSLSTVKIYYDNFEHSHSIYIKKSTDEKFGIELKNESYSSEWKDHTLETEEIKQPYRKTPSERDYKGWNNDFEELLSVLKEKKGKAESFWNAYSNNLYENIFVDKKNADEFIKSKIIIAVNEKYEAIVLDINEIRKKYTDLYKKTKPNEK